MTHSAIRPELWMFASVPHHALIEMAAYLNFSGVIIDDEKVHAGTDEMQAMLLAAEKHALTAKVRLREASWDRIEYILSLGADGILIPRLTDLRAVTEAIASVHFPPRGRRGLGHSRATGYGLNHSWPELITGALRPPTVDIIVETRELLEQVDEVAALEGVDGLDIGLLDLSAALGYAGDILAKDVQSAIDRVIGAARPRGKPVAMSVSTPNAAAELVRRGLSGLVIDAATLLKTGVGVFRAALP